jgi:hypothetical protein
MSLRDPQDLNPVASGPDQSHRIDRSIPCKSCGYELLGLPIDGRCPECGTLVEVSLEPYLPGLEQEKVLDQYRRGLNVNATAWMVMAVLSIGCLGFPFMEILPRPVILFMGFTSAARALSIGQLHASRTLIPGEPAIPIWLLLTLPSCATAAACGLAIGLNPTPLFFGIFVVMTVFEGVVWIEFIRRTALQVECGLVAGTIMSGRVTWTITLLGLLLALMASSGVLKENQLLAICLTAPGLVSWFLSLVLTSILTRSLADALPKLELARPLEDLTLEVEPVTSLPRIVKPVDDAPLPLADSTGTTVEIREVEGLKPPDAEDVKPD